jgi:hypothetical protein
VSDADAIARASREYLRKYQPSPYAQSMVRAEVLPTTLCKFRSFRQAISVQTDRRFRFKPAGSFGGNRQAVSVQSGTPLRMGFGPGFGEPPLRDTSYLALACQSKYSCHYCSF